MFESAYRVHLIRLDGQVIDTPTRTEVHEHPLWNVGSGRMYEESDVAQRFQASHGTRYRVAAVELVAVDSSAGGDLWL